MKVNAMHRVLLILSLLLFPISLSAFQFSSPPTDGYFYIKSTATDKSYEGFLNQKSAASTLVPGANVFVQRMERGQTTDKNRLFRFVATDNGFYYIQSANGGYLALEGGTNTKGTSIIIQGDKESAAKFRFEYKDQEKWKMHTHSGIIVNLNNAYAANNINVQIWWNHTIPSTMWYFEKAGTHQRYTPEGLTGTADAPSDKAGKGFYTLASGEELVYGKVGTDANGKERYTFAIVRKSNPAKKVYRRPFDPYTSRPLSSGRPMRQETEVKSYDRYDYYVLFNGKKFGPWDRIMELLANNPDIDDWVSRDGKSITFSAVKGQRWYPVIASRQGASFWTIGQAPICDQKAGEYRYAMEWSRDTFNIVGKRGFLVKGLKEVKTLTFAEKGTDWLYVAAPEEKNKYYLYLNGTKVTGPHNLFSTADFIPGTSRYYYNAFDPAPGSNGGYTQTVYIDGRKIPLPGNGSVTMKADRRKVVFTYTQVTGSSSPHAKKQIKVYEYDIRNKSLTQHGTYGKLVQIIHNGSFFYYTGYDIQGNRILVSEGGKVEARVALAESGNRSVAARMSPSGDTWLWYEKNGYTKVLKNGKPWNGAGIPFKRVGYIQFNPINGNPQMVLHVDKTVAANSHVLINGDAKYRVTGGMGKVSTHTLFPEKSNDVYWVRRYVLADRSYKWQLYKNTTPLTGSMRTVAALSTSPDGKRYAALVSDREGIISYWPMNRVMDKKLQLFVDGKVIPGTYGAPVWSESAKKFLAIESKGGTLQVVEL